ncbi:MAG: Iron-containing alcohol dehydrogenase [Chthoniobacteraceae bacterium]|nr:Iron-containing alcohol dehydrogenase [Chthoniobacteraceae bacterium]
MNTATYSFPTTIRFGAGTLRELPEHLVRLGVSNPLVVTDTGVISTSAFATLETVLRGRCGIFSNVHPNPIEADVDGAARAYSGAACDGIIAFGGGSALDVGKAVRLRILKPNLRLREFDFSADWRGLAPCIAIPTTAGTGSEVGRSSVIILNGRKKVLFHPELLPSLVILDPELTRTLPAKLTAATGADALTHCIESFTSPVFHPMCEGIALEGIQLIGRSLARAVRDGGDIEARGLMQIAALMGGVAFQKDLGATHSLAHPLSSICGLHHGLANALCLLPVMEFNAARKPGLYERVGIALGIRNADDRATIEAVRALLEEIGLKGGLRPHGVHDSHLDALVEQAFEDGCHLTNPVPVTAEDLRGLYQAAM